MEALYDKFGGLNRRQQRTVSENAEKCSGGLNCRASLHAPEMSYVRSDIFPDTFHRYSDGMRTLVPIEKVSDKKD